MRAATFYVALDRLHSLLYALLSLRSAASPEYFSAVERVKRASTFSVSNKTALTSFLEGNADELYFSCGAGKWGITNLNVDGWYVATLYATRGEDSLLEETLVAVASCSDFAFGCAEPEQQARNFVVIQAGDMSVESYVGRALERYIPGLYWRTYFSARLLSERALDVSSLGAEAVRRTADGSVVSMFARSKDWRAHAERIEAVLAAHPQFFSRRKLDATIARGAMSMKKADNLIDRWP